MNSKAVFIILTSFLFSSCVLIKENKERKRLERIEYETTYNPKEDKDLIDISGSKIKPNNPDTEYSNPNEIWYHPNPWWRIESEPFPVSADSLKFKNFTPQYGFTKFTNPITNSKSNGWNVWNSMNHFDNKDNEVNQVWGTFIGTYKDILKAHPEYLAENNGKRPGYGKTSKLCVSNKNLQKLYIEYIKNLIGKFPDRKVFSVEPSDGAGYCTCDNCLKIGISAQPFYLANVIAKAIKKDFPDKQLGVIAYYNHAEVPKFKLEKNIKVVVAVQGFQHIYSPLGILSAWRDHHENLGLREFYIIPQYQAELPRLRSSYFYSNIRFMHMNKMDMVKYESGTSLFAILTASMLSKMMLNPDLEWEDVFNKFLNDAFKESRVPIERLLRRWYDYTEATDIEINYSIYDILEAERLTADKNELQRIRDFKAYLLYIIYYLEWRKDIKNLETLTTYFDFINNISNRNIVNTVALSRIFSKPFSEHEELKNKYHYTAKKDWVKFYSDIQIDSEFSQAVKKYPPIKVNYLTIDKFADILNKERPNYFEKISINTKNRYKGKFYSASRTMSITPIFKSANNALSAISVFDEDGKFVKQKLSKSGEIWTIELPHEGIYNLTQNRIANVDLNLQGKFLLLLQDTKTIKKETSYNIMRITSERKIIPAEETHEIIDTAPYFIITRKD